MSAGDARHGRRDNGLVAAEYAAAGDVDPRVGEHLLDVLALDGIAAYLRPSTDLHPVTRSTSLPGRPTDRLYVDRAHLSTARAYLTRLTDEPEEPPAPVVESLPAPSAPSSSAAPSSATSNSDADLDEAWAQIVAGYSDEAPEPTRARPADPEERPTTSTRVDPLLVYRPTPTQEPSLLDALDTFGADLPDDEDERYTPPVAPPVPRPSLPVALAVFGIVGGLLVFLRPDLLPMAEGVAMLLGFGAVVGGFVTLVWRLRPGDDDDDEDPDHGAKV